MFTHNDCWYKSTCPMYDHGCKHTCPRFYEMLLLMKESGLPEQYWHTQNISPCEEDLESYAQLANYRNNIKTLVEQKKVWLFISSTEHNNGKTIWATKILKQYFASVWENNGGQQRGLFVHYPTFLQETRSKEFGKREELIKSLMDTEFLVLDDVGFMPISENTYYAIFYPILKHRWQKLLPTILTGQLLNDSPINEFFSIGSTVSRIKGAYTHEGGEQY